MNLKWIVVELSVVDDDFLNVFQMQITERLEIFIPREVDVLEMSKLLKVIMKPYEAVAVQDE